MADTIQYGMGQMRFSHTSTYMSPCAVEANEVKVQVSSDATDAGNQYQDIMITPEDGNFEFSYGTSYLFKITIPKDLNYNNTYRIKLVASSQSTSFDVLNPDTVDYQMLKYINVPKETNNSNSSRVIIYPIKISDGTLGIDDDGTYETKVAIAADKEEDVSIGGVYFNNNKYYLKTEDGNLEIQNKNDIMLNHIWTSGQSISGVDFSFIFTPRETDKHYNRIWVEMFRETYDQDIYSDGVYGRKIDLPSEIFDVKIYALTNLIGTAEYQTGTNALTHVGVYGHPNTIMSINGEEIRIGQSGYYELNNFEITSFCIAAEDENDKFIMDYQYQITN